MNNLNMPFRTIVGMSALFITYSYNDILLFSGELIVFANLLFFVLVALLLGELLLEKDETPPLLSWAILGAVFLAGINIRFKIKMMVFLSIAYVLMILLAWIRARKGMAIPAGRYMGPLVAAVITIAAIVLAATGVLNTYVLFGISLALVALECGVFLMRVRAHS